MSELSVKQFSVSDEDVCLGPILKVRSIRCNIDVAALLFVKQRKVRSFVDNDVCYLNPWVERRLCPLASLCRRPSAPCGSSTSRRSPRGTCQRPSTSGFSKPRSCAWIASSGAGNSFMFILLTFSLAMINIGLIGFLGHLFKVPDVCILVLLIGRQGRCPTSTSCTGWSS